MLLQKKDATAEEAEVDGSTAAANGEMEIDAPATSAEPAVNGTATAEKKKKKKKRTAEEATLEAAPAEDGGAAEEAPKTAKKKDKAAANGAVEAPTTEKKVLQTLPSLAPLCTICVIIHFQSVTNVHAVPLMVTGLGMLALICKHKRPEMLFSPGY